MEALIDNRRETEERRMLKAVSAFRAILKMYDTSEESLCYT